MRSLSHYLHLPAPAHACAWIHTGDIQKEHDDFTYTKEQLPFRLSLHLGDLYVSQVLWDLRIELQYNHTVI